MIKQTNTSNAGFTLTELIAVVGFLAALALVGAIGYIFFHFLAKIW